MHSPKTTHKLRSVIHSLSKLQIKSSFKNSPRVVYSVIALTVVIAVAGFGIKQWQKHREAKLQEQVAQTLKKNAQTVRFMENKGQLPDNNVLYYFDTPKGSTYIERDKIRFVAFDTEEGEAKMPDPRVKPLVSKPKKERIVKGSHTFTLNLEGSNPDPKVKLGEAFGTRYNYFLGADSKKWTTGVQAAKDLTLQGVYPGVDLRLYSTDEGTLEFDWVMAPGADYSQVKMHFTGQDGLAVANDGSLKVGLRFTDVKFHLPESYQVTDKGKQNVNIAFNKSDENTITFATDSNIDSRYSLVIDPILQWGSFMDGNATTNVFDEYLFAIQSDPVTEIVYCAGATNIVIPTASAPYDANGYLNSVTGLAGGGNTGEAVAVIYRVSADGTDLMDLTLYGPSNVTTNIETNAYALSLSNNKVFVGGFTEDTVPTTANAFDNSLNGKDGFVAVFPKDLGTLDYATYIGSTGTDPGVFSIRALSDDSFVIGANVTAALPAAYISAGAADSTQAGNESYIAKFTTFSTLSYGTYVGGNSNELINDVEVLADGRVVFIGTTNSTTGLTEVNSAASSGSNDDFMIGVLNATGTSFDYLDKIGGSSDDRGYDADVYNGKIYFTGSSFGTGFPTSTGAYDTSFNAGSSSGAIIGVVDVGGGSSNYKATYFGGTNGATLGNTIKVLYSSPCIPGNFTNPIVMMFGSTSATDMPTKNVQNEAFWNDTSQGDLDIIFAGFTSDLSQLSYATYIGGSAADYLGETGVPAGANNLWFDGVGNLYVGTTTHSSSHVPTLASGGFDTTKSNGTNDAHIMFKIDVATLGINDYGDAPATFGAPSHAMKCDPAQATLRLGALRDPEGGPFASVNADGDNVDGSNDEDSVASPPTVSIGGPQNISVTVSVPLNTTGSTANLYAWIDLNSDGQFSSGEFQSTTVANGFSGNKTLTWTGVTISGATPKPYLRLRLTTDSLTDTAGTAAVDERSITPAGNGEVEDYLLATLASTDLAITKTDGATTAVPGAPISYTIVVNNNGPSNAIAASVADAVPATITGVTASCVASGTASCGTNASSGNAVSFTGVNINAGAGNFLTITVSGTVSPSATGSLTNTATVTAGSGQQDLTPGNNSATDTDTLTPQTDLSITKTDGSATYTAGNAISYTIVVANAGPSNATGASVSDTVPASITGVTASCVATGTASCGTNASAGNNVSFTGVNINAGAGNSLTITVSGTVSAGATGNLTNTASVAAGSGQTDPTPGNNSATDTDTPNAITDLAITKTDGSATYTAGNAISYTITVSNGGPSNATGASIADTVPASITGVTASCVATGTASCGTNASAGNNVSFTGVNINAGAGNSLTITVSGTVSAGATGNLTNTASVTAGSGQTDNNSANNSATDTDTPNAITDLAITKTDGSATYTPGNAISYTVVVSNSGPTNAVGASMADTVPAVITGVTASCVATGTANCGTKASAGNNVSFTGVNINAGAGNFLTITVSGTVSAGATGSLTNTATVTAGAGQTDPTSGNNSATDTDAPNALTDLSITKTDGSATYTAGNAISYTIVVSNAGPSNATGASIADSVPASITE